MDRTLGRFPASPPFLGSQNAPRADVVILGIPLDITETFRSGTGLAPQRIRQVSDCLETYSPAQCRDLVDIALCDWGDLNLDGVALSEALAMIETEVARASCAGFPIILGGEHTLSLAAARALRPQYPDLAVVKMDAHLDLIDEYAGLRVSHATVGLRLAEEIGWSALAQVGVRSGTRAEFEASRSCLHSSSDLTLPAPVMQTLGSRPVYLSIDIDVLDPAFAPGTGCPEPGGASFQELVSFLSTLASLRVVGVDIVEVLPAIDVADITSVAAAKLVREAALLFSRSTSEESQREFRSSQRESRFG